MSHSHAPGENHSHSHSPAPQQQQQQQMIIPPADPLLQAAIEKDYKPVNLKLGPPSDSQALCGPHSLEKCEDCDLDFVALNNLAKIFVANPNLACPPPTNVIQVQRAQAVTKTKEDGNVHIPHSPNLVHCSYVIYRLSGIV